MTYGGVISLLFSTLFVSSKSSTKSLVISVPFRDPTAQTSLVSDALILQTTPPFRRESNDTKSRICRPVSDDHSFTVPSSEEVIINRPLYCNDVTAD